MTTFEYAAITARAKFTNPANGNPMNPGAVFFRWRAPNGEVELRQFGEAGSPAITNPEVGTFEIQLDTTLLAGTWRVHAWSTGAGQASKQEEFFAAPVIRAA